MLVAGGIVGGIILVFIEIKYKNSNIKEGQTSLGNDKGRPELGAIKPNKAVAFLNESESLGFERAKWNNKVTFYCRWRYEK